MRTGAACLFSRRKNDMKRWIAAALALMLCAGCAAAPESAAASSISVSQSEPENSPAPDQPQTSIPAPAEPPALSEPMLVTSFGQSIDGLLVREMLTDLGAVFTYEPIASPEILPDYPTVILAVGASAKALDASGLNSAEEYDRAEQLLCAVPDSCTVVMIRLGDSANQDSLTSDLIQLTLPYADLILATESGDRSGTIAQYAAEQKLPCLTRGTVREMKELLGEMSDSKPLPPA